jgi:hypothetical protein
MLVGLRTNLAYRSGVIVHLVDGTYELFRYFMSPAAAFERTAPEELRSGRGVVTSMLGMLEGGAISASPPIRDRFAGSGGYKTGEGTIPCSTASSLEEALRSGVVGYGRVPGRRRWRRRRRWPPPIRGSSR